MDHVMRLHPKPFAMVAAGTKTVELRLNDEKRQRLVRGDKIVFVQRPENAQRCTCEVVALRLYGTLADLAAHESLTPAGFLPGEGLDAVTSALQQYYSEEDIGRYGLLAIEIRRVDDETISGRI